MTLQLRTAMTVSRDRRHTEIITSPMLSDIVRTPRKTRHCDTYKSPTKAIRDRRQRHRQKSDILTMAPIEHNLGIQEHLQC